MLDSSHERAVSSALRFLSSRPRSEREVRRRLERSYTESTVESAVQRLRELGLLDDEAFARAWSQSRAAHRPRSAAMIRRELQAKGVEREVAQESVEPLDDRESAYRAGLRCLPSLTGADYYTFRRRMWGRLQRRGFAQALIRETVTRLWEELADEGEQRPGPQTLTR